MSLPTPHRRSPELTEAVLQASATVRAHPLRSALGATAIAVAVATMAIVVTALDGVAEYARATAARAFGSNTFVIAQIGARGQISRRELEERLQRNPAVTRRDLRFLERYDGGIVEYGASAQRGAEVSSGSRSYENAAVVGATASLSSIRDLAIARGRFFGPEEEAQAAQIAVIGADIATTLFPDRDPLGATLRLAGRGFVVVGVQERLGNVGGTSLDRNVWIPLRAFERTFGPPQTLQVLARAPQDTGSAGRATLAAEDRARISMRARRQLAPGAADNFDVLTPDAARGFVLNLSQRIGLAAGPISLMALLAAIVVVTNTILVSVTQRTREIGVRRALGATQGQVLREVLAESTLIAIAGGAAGLAGVGLLIGGIGGATGFDLTLRTSTVAFSLAAALASGLLAGWYPARRATKIDVIAAIRTE